MGYHVTSADDVKPSTPKTAYPRSAKAISGHRYFQPETGRWASRDPIRERGGKNLYGYVRNSPVDFTDYRGLGINDPPNSFPTGCCDGKPYALQWACCCNKKIISNTPVDIGVKKCCEYDASSVIHGTLGVPIHCYISCGGHAWGLYPSGIHDDTPDDQQLPDGAPDPARYPFTMFKKCEPIKLDPCKYDIAKVKACACSGGKSQNYILAGTCIGWANSAGNCLSGNDADCK
jgi:hypothetical protein